MQLLKVEREFLQKVNELMSQKLSESEEAMAQVSPQMALKRACAHLCIGDSAKRIRPLMCLYFYLLNHEEPLPMDLVKASVAAEFIHSASLMHDDIVDGAQLRRGKPSLNELYGNDVAVLAGDFLLTEGFDLIKDLHESLIKEAIKAVRKMSKAAMLEIMCRKKREFSIGDWRDIAEGKTGALFSWCAFAAQNFAKKNFPLDLEIISVKIGFIFQMADDIKDFTGDNSLKDICQDIFNKDHSLPIILAMSDSLSIKNAFGKAFSKNTELDFSEVEKLKNMVLSSKAIFLAKEMMQQEILSLENLMLSHQGTLGKNLIDAWMRFFWQSSTI